MKESVSTLFSKLKSFQEYYYSRHKYINEDPLRSELFSSDQMAHHSRILSRSHSLLKKPGTDRLLPRLADNSRVLAEVRNLLMKSISDESLISPAGEWLLDNFYLIEEQVRIARRHLPRGYSEGLPQLSVGVSAGLPRVYDIVLEIISHSDGRIDMENVSNFLVAYNSVTQLRLGELWAIPIMLRLALIENLRRVSVSMALDRMQRNEAETWARQMMDTAESNPKNLIMILADLARTDPALDRSFVAEMTRQLRGKGTVLAQVLTWIEERLAENGLTSSELIQAENQKQAADQVSVSNSIGSLRLLGSMDWRKFVETHSIVEKVLCEDPVYPLMDFSTRDHYRHVVERVAKRAKRPEEEVARIAMKLAADCGGQVPGARTAHVGYYLIGKGLARTEAMASVRLSLRDQVRRALAAHPLWLYVGSILLLTAAMSSLMTVKAYRNTQDIWLSVVVAFLAVGGASQMAAALINFLVTLTARPDLLPRMDFSDGIPDSAHSLVVVPSLLTSVHEVESLVESLEVYYLANKDPNLHFGLLTDYKDALEKDTPEDELLLQCAIQKITDLNQKYNASVQSRFFLFHRPREWNPRERRWMGHERKRGKLADLNGLLRGKSGDRFSHIVGDHSLLGDVRYVITLDADTQLPRDSAQKMVGTMAHVLNHAHYDARRRRVTEGYGILQPRVAIGMSEAGRSYYMGMNEGEEGIDPYTRAVSDVYQDLFGEGSFIGKGIYDVDIFERALEGKFPENRILSHDLLEGCYVRSGLLSDVQLYEKYPSSYITDMRRRHRWMRGDWQIYAWSMPFVPGGDNRLHRNPLSALSRWKIFDNIRRSMAPVALTALLVISWLLLPGAGEWTLIISSLIILPPLITSVWDIIRKPKDVNMVRHMTISAGGAAHTALRTLFGAICLPYEAYVCLDAIIRSTWRMLISRRRLLEWNHYRADHMQNKNLRTFYLSMWAEPALALALMVWMVVTVSAVYVPACTILLLWLCAPLIAWWISTPLPGKSVPLAEEQKIFLKKLARKTWSFFELVVTEGDNWLPPDNYQEYPVEVLAHRTSPTNIGLSLLANLSAYDFGFISMGRMLERTGHTLDTMHRMERYEGHLYNWYDTVTLHPLLPRYISAVDSGNLAGHMLTLKQGLMGLPRQKVVTSALFDGLRSTLLVLIDALQAEGGALQLQSLRSELDTYCHAEPQRLQEVKSRLETLQKNYAALIPDVQVQYEDAQRWKNNFAAQMQDALDELKFYAPWLWLKPVPHAFKKIAELTGSVPTLYELADMEDKVHAELQNLYAQGHTADEREWLSAFEAAVTDTGLHVAARLAQIDEMAVSSHNFADMSWGFLYDKAKNLLSIGYNIDEHRCDPGFYDLLASEARLCVFVAIAQGKLPQESWFALGRLLTNINGSPILLSWSGSMFEYLMPQLVMPGYSNTLLDQTNEAAVAWQVEYGRQRGIPWGISESGYNMVDAAQNYQYMAFGAPGLGLKRGLGEDTVIAPYASMLALMIAPEAACTNLQAIAAEGFEGRYGLYEAIDYTPSRLSRGQSFAIVQSYMSHHQGMGLLSMAYLLLDRPMQRRFESEPQFQATLLLLQEKIPQSVAVFAHTNDLAEFRPTIVEPEVRIIRTPNTPIPEVQLLSNGKYHVMLTNSGGGYSRWKGIAITRWREDVTCDQWGAFCYIRDLESQAFWSVAHQPTHKKWKNYEAVFSQGRADFRTTFNNIETHTEIVISPEDDIEMRRLSVTNRSNRPRTIDVTSYAEIVIAQQASDDAHPAFSNLFVETEILQSQNAIICTRRPRSPEERPPFVFHLMKIHDKDIEHLSFETSRLKFTGRGNTINSPQVMKDPGPLSGSDGPVLDPIVSIRHQLTIQPGETVAVDMIIGVAETREACQSLIDKYQDKHHKDRVYELAWTHSQVILRHINATEADAQLYTRMASSVIFINPVLRAEQSVLIKNRRGQAGLWPYSISGDLPIVLLRVEEESNIDLVRQMIQAHSYWLLKGLAVDLIIINENHGGYRQVLQNQILGLIAAQPADQAGSIFVRSAEQLSAEDRILFQTVARLIITGQQGTLIEQISRRGTTRAVMPYLEPDPSFTSAITPLVPPSDLLFFNGWGGFSPRGNEYIITINEKKSTPAPWVNVIANPDFGTVVSESGPSYTWAENAHEFRLTPWGNDPVNDVSGEAFYLRDEDTGYYWSPTPLPRSGRSGYQIRHGFGYSVFEHIEAGIHSEMWIYVDVALAVKFTVLKLKNLSGRQRRISATGYVEWVLGDLRTRSASYIITEQDPETGALIARNPYSTEFNERLAFFDTDEPVKTFTGSRTEFIGRNGTLRSPDAMLRTRLSGRTGTGMDPCAAIQASFDLYEGQEREVVFKMGAGKNIDEVRHMLRSIRGLSRAHEALDKVHAQWTRITGNLQIHSPDPALDLLANGWLTYQTLSSRLWARSGYYQSGGAFGFRDQLQDVMSLLHVAPELAQRQILLCAAHQFREGDVQHWWHPPVGRGVRTRCSDDFLWLAYATIRYVDHTGDTAILDEPAPFLEGRLLNPDEESYYELSMHSGDQASLYDHCVRAIRHGLRFGVHGLPLMGTGDWNDGMDRVGKEGRGESIWLAFFTYDILQRFVHIARLRGDAQFAVDCEAEAAKLKGNVHAHGWDGDWYLRAYFDDGSTIGSHSNAEAQIDSIAQSWSVLSGAGEEQRSLKAMDSAYRRLVSTADAVVRLLDPPFDKSDMNPGYIKGYIPGVRENGGQYTHAAIWLVMAFAKLKDKKRTWELLNMINPINHGRTQQEIEVYKVEPYVIAADVYSQAPHRGQGGWTWYTGSAGWMNTMIAESLLGLRLHGDRLSFDPCIPEDWASLKIDYRYRSSMYHITLIQTAAKGDMTITIDHTQIVEQEIRLVDDGQDHEVEVRWA